MLSLMDRWKLRGSSDNEPYNSTSIIASNNHLLTEILLHLPVKSLVRFKSVSKLWLLLISDLYFARYHQLRNNPPISGLFLYQFTTLSPPEFEFIPLNETVRKAPFKLLTFVRDPSGIIIQQSCNGLFCCTSFVTSLKNSSYYIYNPTSRQHTTLPRPQGIIGITTDTSTICSVSLAFDPLYSPHYKVVCAWKIDASSDQYQLEIYNSMTASWRPCGGVFTANEHLISKSGLFWNGSLHWIFIKGLSSLRLDVNKEHFSTIPMPHKPHGQQERRFEYFGASRNHLHLVERYDKRNQLYFLEMDKDYSGWNVKHRINLDEVVIAYPEMLRGYLGVFDWNYYAFSVLLVLEEEFILHVPGKVIAYSLKNKTFMMLKDLSPRHIDFQPYLQYQCFDSFPYIETLTCV